MHLDVFPRTPVLLLCGLFAVGMAGCDDGGEASDEGHETHGDHGDSGEMMSVCSNEDRADDFSIGMSKSGATLDVVMADADPSVPFRGDNAWTLMLTDASGMPVEQVTLEIRPWMPDHGHGTPVEAEVSDLGGGEYLVEPVNLFMAGLWEVTFSFDMVDGTSDEVMIAVCVE